MIFNILPKIVKNNRQGQTTNSLANDKIFHSQPPILVYFDSFMINTGQSINDIRTVDKISIAGYALIQRTTCHLYLQTYVHTDDV